MEGLGVEAAADWHHVRTPETYLGYWRSGRFASPLEAAFDERRGYELPRRLEINHWALAVHDAVRDRTVEIAFLEPGAEAYSFTFG